MTNLEAPVLVPHAAATGTSAGHKGETKYSYEILFRSQHYALADNACREYLFLCEFFHVEGAPALELFQEVMGKTCGLYMVQSMCSHDERLIDSCVSFRNLSRTTFPPAMTLWPSFYVFKWSNAFSTSAIKGQCQP